MKIRRIDLWHVAIPLAAPFHPSWIPGFRQTENRFDLLRLTTESGLVGWSAAPRMATERSGLGALLGPYLLGERADDIESINQRVREMGYLGTRVGWIEAACWDIVGKSRNKPVYELLGGGPGDVGLYASTGEVRTGSERVDEVSARLAEGFAAVKLRVHADTLEEDIAQLESTRAGVGDAAVLGVDANQGWRVAAIADCARWDPARALAFCRAAEANGFAWVEEPLPQDAYGQLADLTANTTVKIAGGELNNQGLPEFRTMVARGCYDWYQPDAVFTGGISKTWAILGALEEAGAVYTPHTWTNGIGFAINLQIFAASQSRARGKLLEYPYDPPGWVERGRDGLLAAPFQHRGGRLPLPSGPGLGFDIDGGQLRRHGHRFFTASPVRVAVRAVLDRGLGAARELGATRTARLDARAAALATMDDPAMHGLARASG
jgi:L-alanine-DL-glutamate epimerase-like enolase superfamily enzyme